MSKIYCIYCGKENDIQNKKCEKCKKELDPKEHLWKDYFYEKAKGKVEGETKKNLFKLFINYIKSHLYGIAISLSLIVTAITGIEALTNTNYIQKVEEKPMNQREELSLDDTLVKQLYSYQNYNYDHYLNAIYDDNKDALDFYEDKLVTYNTLKEEAKLYIAYQNASLKALDVSIQTCDDLKGYNYVYDMCIKQEAMGVYDVHIALPFDFYGIDSEKLDKTYYNLFGMDKKIDRTLGQVRIARTKACEYNTEKKQYLCYQLPEGWLSMTEEKTKLVKAIKVGNKIELYDYFVVIARDSEDWAVYKNFNRTIKVAEDFTDEVMEQGQLHKHTYRKDSNGNYYWVQSEPVDVLPEI